MKRPVLAAAVVVCALVVSASASASVVQRLAYTKAVAYWKAEAKAHGMPIVCAPFVKGPSSAELGCTFGTVNRTEVLYGGKCAISVAVFEKTHSIRGGSELTGAVGNVLVQMCRPGWQRSLPSPWALPPR